MPMEFKVQLDEEIVVTVNDDGTIREVWGADEDRTYDHSSFLDWAKSLPATSSTRTSSALSSSPSRRLATT